MLILVDEIMDYIRQLSDTENADLAVRDMAFLRALLDSVNDVPHVAAVVVMIASEKDNMDLDGAGQQRRNELDALLIRNGETATINDNTDFAAILQRRLFERTAPAEVLAATARTFTTQMTGPWRDKVFNAVPATASPEFPDEVARCYPFHPQLMALAEQEWAKLAGFQRVRSTIRIFAATAHSLHKRGKAGEWTPLLVGPGDLPCPTRQCGRPSSDRGSSSTRARRRTTGRLPARTSSRPTTIPALLACSTGSVPTPW